MDDQVTEPATDGHEACAHSAALLCLATALLGELPEVDYAPMVVAEAIIDIVLADRQALRGQLASCDRTVVWLREENDRLRKTAAHVPAKDYIKAKEAAGVGTVIGHQPVLRP
jgi:hypothetical protein